MGSLRKGGRREDFTKYSSSSGGKTGEENANTNRGQRRTESTEESRKTRRAKHVLLEKGAGRNQGEEKGGLSFRMGGAMWGR